MINTLPCPSAIAKSLVVPESHAWVITSIPVDISRAASVLLVTSLTRWMSQLAMHAPLRRLRSPHHLQLSRLTDDVVPFATLNPPEVPFLPCFHPRLSPCIECPSPLLVGLEASMVP